MEDVLAELWRIHDAVEEHRVAGKADDKFLRDISHRLRLVCGIVADAQMEAAEDRAVAQQKAAREAGQGG